MNRRSVCLRTRMTTALSTTSLVSILPIAFVIIRLSTERSSSECPPSLPTAHHVRKSSGTDFVFQTKQPPSSLQRTRSRFMEGREFQRNRHTTSAFVTVFGPSHVRSLTVALARYTFLRRQDAYSE